MRRRFLSTKEFHMDKIRVTGGTMHIGQGVIISLTEEQASPRLHALERLGDDLFKANQILQFKAGEVLGIKINDIVKSERHMARHVALGSQVVEHSSPVAAPIQRLKTVSAHRRKS